jgi:hypothetical protein
MIFYKVKQKLTYMQNPCYYLYLLTKLVNTCQAFQIFKCYLINILCGMPFCTHVQTGKTVLCVFNCPFHCALHRNKPETMLETIYNTLHILKNFDDFL